MPMCLESFLISRAGNFTFSTVSGLRSCEIALVTEVSGRLVVVVIVPFQGEPFGCRVHN